jgi:hypothetical protein
MNGSPLTAKHAMGRDISDRGSDSEGPYWEAGSNSMRIAGSTGMLIFGLKGAKTRPNDVAAAAIWILYRGSV